MRLKSRGIWLWCLKELVKILHCMDGKNQQIVVTIFQQVNPSDIRRLTRSFSDDFIKHQDDPNSEIEEVKRCSTKSLQSGWDSRDYRCTFNLFIFSISFFSFWDVCNVQVQFRVTIFIFSNNCRDDVKLIEDIVFGGLPCFLYMSLVHPSSSLCIITQGSPSSEDLMRTFRFMV